jgi:hypothetical protein
MILAFLFVAPGCESLTETIVKIYHRRLHQSWLINRKRRVAQSRISQKYLMRTCGNVGLRNVAIATLDKRAGSA